MDHIDRICKELIPHGGGGGGDFLRNETRVKPTQLSTRLWPRPTELTVADALYKSLDGRIMWVCGCRATTLIPFAQKDKELEIN